MNAKVIALVSTPNHPISRPEGGEPLRPVAICLLMFILAAGAFADTTPQKKERNPIFVVKTSMGDIQVELFADETPETVRNFIDLAEGTKEFTDPATGKKVKRPFYDGLTFHRVIKNFMLQGGCPKGDGTGDPGYRFEDEINASALGLDKLKAIQPDGRVHAYLMVRSKQDYSRVIVMPLARSMGINSQEAFDARQKELKQRIASLTLKECYENTGYRYTTTRASHAPLRGVIAMANSGPNTNGSQFFINLVDTPWLSGKHTVFGKVVAGMDVVDTIGNVKTGAGDRPAKPIKILSIKQLAP